MGIRGELYSTKVVLDNRTYFFNVKENRNGDLYLNMVESKNKDAGGFDRQSIVLFADDLQNFLKGFDESLKVMEKSVRERKRSGREDSAGKDRGEFKRRDADDEERPRRDREGDGDSKRPHHKDDGERKRYVRKTEGDRPQRDGDRPQRDDDRPQRAPYGDRPQRPSFGDRPQRPGFGERPQRTSVGDRPQRPGFGDKPRRPGFGDRPQHSAYGDRPQRAPYGDRPREEGGFKKPYAPRGEGYQGGAGFKSGEGFKAGASFKGGFKAVSAREFDGDAPRKKFAKSGPAGSGLARARKVRSVKAVRRERKDD